MKASICTITYNQEAFIREALDSILRQKVDFDFEVVVSDDASTDGTPAILKEYQQRYPGIVRVILHEKNIGMLRNFYSAIAACKGDFVAICEGDDYWTDEGKLQMQVDFLETHPDFAICFHRCGIVFSGMDPVDFPDYNAGTPPVTGFKDLIKGNYIHTPSCVFRNHLFDEVPPVFMELGVGDWALHMLNASKGKLYFIDKEMAAYRVSGQGVWSTRKQISRVENAIRFLKKVQPVLGSGYAEEFRNSIRNYSRFLLKLYVRNREFKGLISRLPNLIINCL